MNKNANKKHDKLKKVATMMCRVRTQCKIVAPSEICKWRPAPL